MCPVCCIETHKSKLAIHNIWVPISTLQVSLSYYYFSAVFLFLGGRAARLSFKLIFLFLKANMKIFNSKAFLIGHEAMVK